MRIMKWKKCKFSSLKSIIRFRNSFKMLERCYKATVQMIKMIWFNHLKQELTLTTWVKENKPTMVPKNH